MRFLTFFILITTAIQAAAQVKNLPYRNGFETSGDRAEFKTVRLGDSATAGWGYHLSPLKYAYHDYPVGGSQDDTVSDWLFTPPVKITTGAVLSFRYYVYGITGSATPSDEFSIWYGKRNINPGNGTYVKLFDLTNKISTSTNWTDTAGIVLPFTTDTGYVAFRYRATNNWFTVAVDSVVLKIPGLSVHNPSMANAVQLYPNPCQDVLQISSDIDLFRVSITGMDGRLVLDRPIDQTTNSISLKSLDKGIYTIQFETAAGIINRRLVKI